MSSVVAEARPTHSLIRCQAGPDEVHLVCERCSYVKAYPLLLTGEIDGRSPGVVITEGDGQAGHRRTKQ